MAFGFRGGGVGFEGGQDGFGAVEDFLGEAGEAGDLDAVGFVGGAGDDLAEEDDAVVPLAHGDAVVFHGGAAAGEGGEFVIVGGEDGAAADGVVEVLGDGQGRPQPIQQLVIQGLVSRGGGTFAWLLKQMG